MFVELSLLENLGKSNEIVRDIQNSIENNLNYEIGVPQFEEIIQKYDRKVESAKLGAFLGSYTVFIYILYRPWGNLLGD